MTPLQIESLADHLRNGRYGDAIEQLLDHIANKPVVSQSKIFKTKAGKSVSRGFAVLTARLPVNGAGEYTSLETPTGDA